MIIIFTKDWTYKGRTHKKHTANEMISFAAVEAIRDGCAVAAPDGMSLDDIREQEYIEKHFKKRKEVIDLDDDADDDMGTAKPPKWWSR